MKSFIFLLFGTLFFFIPGCFLSWMIFKKIKLSHFIAYSIIFSVFFSITSTFILWRIGLINLVNIIIFYIFFIISSFLLILFKKQKCLISKDYKLSLIFLLFAFVGTLWRWFFRSQVYLWGDGFEYKGLSSFIAFKTGSTQIPIPDLGFYTGMLADHSSIVAGGLSEIFYSFIGFTGAFQTFVIVFLLAFFTYKVIYTYRKDNKLALFGSFIIAAIGSGEIWLNTLSFFLGGGLAIIATMSLFILLKKKNSLFITIPLSLAIILALSYLTGTFVMILVSAGFILSLIIKAFIDNKYSLKNTIKSSSKNPKILQYLLIFIVSLVFFFIFASSIINFTENTTLSILTQTFSLGEETSKTTFVYDKEISEPTPKPTFPYEKKYTDPIFGWGMDFWQNILFLLVASTFFIYLYIRWNRNRNFLKEDKDILIAMLPVFIVTFAFNLVNMEQRTFAYMSFFAILISKIPKKIFPYLTIFFVISSIGLGYFANMEKIPFFENTKLEVEGAEWVSKNLDSKLLSDQKFINLLIQKGYYNVTGFSDNSPFFETLYLSNNLTEIRDTFSLLNVSYFVTTARMREHHILMLNFPSIPMNNSYFYKKNFPETYNNGDVRVYYVGRNKE